jgi:hypothetical protein
VELEAILDRLSHCRDGLQRFADDGGTAELFVHWHFMANSGETLAAQLLGRLSEYRLDLALDIYPDRDWLEDLEPILADEPAAGVATKGNGGSHGAA